MGGCEARTQGALVSNLDTGATEDAAARRISAAPAAQLSFWSELLVPGGSVIDPAPSEHGRDDLHVG
jgi:hypothetical protein